MAGALTLFLVRHATHEMVNRVLCGRMPGVGLGPEGIEQAGRVARRLGRESLAAVHSSPQPRAQQTAAPIAAAAGLAPVIDPGLDEIDFGAWTGRSFAALAPDPDWQRWNARRGSTRTPGGETMRGAQARVLAWLDLALQRHGGERVAAISHGDVIRAALCGVLGLSLGLLHRLEVAPGSISTLVLWPGGGKLLGLNLVPGG